MLREVDRRLDTDEITVRVLLLVRVVEDEGRVLDDWRDEEEPLVLEDDRAEEVRDELTTLQEPNPLWHLLPQ